jgi:hypothetical protein
MTTQLTILTETQICTRFRTTPEDMDAMTRIIDTRTGRIYWTASSKSEPHNEEAGHCVDIYRSRMTCTCAANGATCWAMHAALACAFELLQEERVKMAAEAAEAEAKAKEEAERRANTRLGEEVGFSLLKPALPVAKRGYDIRIQRVGKDWLGEKMHAWAGKDELPVEWTEVCADPSVVRAVIFFSSEASKRADKRRHLAEYDRLVAVAI